MILLLALSFFIFDAKIVPIAGQETALCVVKFEEDPILKIENLEMARKLNIPHSSWALCNDYTDEDEMDRNTSFTVSKSVLTVVGHLEKEIGNFECKLLVKPSILQNKQNKKILEVGYEIYNSKNIIGEVDPSQSNENVQIPSQKTAAREKVEKIFSTLTKESHWITVLSIINNEKNWYSDYQPKQITYEILNADNPSEEITCPYLSGSFPYLFSERDLKLIYSQQNMRKQITKDDPDSLDITIELLVPKKHLNSYGRQLTACVRLNMLPMWTTISQSSWAQTNNFMMHVAEVLGRLQVIAGTTGVLQLKNSKGPINLTFDYDTVNLKMPKIMWRIVKYTLTSPRYGTTLDFGIIVITHTDDVKEHKDDIICPSICEENGWEVENAIELGSTYCCPVIIEVLNKLKIGDVVSPIQKVFNFKKLRELKTSYEKFNESFLI